MCGIFGVCSRDNSDEASKLTFFGLNALQHRGQESVGIGVSTGKDIRYQKYQGMVSHVFRENNMNKLTGKIAVGHVRYSTSGDKESTGNIQPYIIYTRDGPILIAHNGELTEANALRQRVLESGKNFFTTSDTETIVHIMYEKEIDAKMIPEDLRFEGAFLLITDENFGEMLIRVESLKEDKAVLDFNHPLAGKTLTFNVKVLDIS